MDILVISGSPANRLPMARRSLNPARHQVVVVADQAAAGSARSARGRPFDIVLAHASPDDTLLLDWLYTAGFETQLLALCLDQGLNPDADMPSLPYENYQFGAREVAVDTGGRQICYKEDQTLVAIDLAEVLGTGDDAAYQAYDPDTGHVLGKVPQRQLRPLLDWGRLLLALLKAASHK